MASPGDVIKRLELKKYKWGRNLIKIELLLIFFHPIPFTTIQLIGFVETLIKILIYLKILKFLISSFLNLANGPQIKALRVRVRRQIPERVPTAH